MELDTIISLLDLPETDAVALPLIPTVASIYAVAMPEERSFDRWFEADKKARGFGYIALGLGDDNALNGLQQHLSQIDSWDVLAERRLAEDVDVEDWFNQEETMLISDGDDLPLGTWPADLRPKRSGVWFPFDREGNHLNPWWMLLVPAGESWSVPLSLAYGNWNDCPPAHVHAAICKRWEASHCAYLVAVGPDTIEFRVERSPSTRTAALTLAREHYLYCADIVDQGIGSISALAAHLIDNSVWSFWWD